MTVKKLIAEAAKLRGWRLLRGGLLRRYPIKGKHLRECPLTAVANIKDHSHRYKDPGLCYEAARALRIPRLAAQQLVRAADKGPKSYPKELREELLRALRVKR